MKNVQFVSTDYPQQTRPGYNFPSFISLLDVSFAVAPSFSQEEKPKNKRTDTQSTVVEGWRCPSSSRYGHGSFETQTQTQGMGHGRMVQNR